MADHVDDLRNSVEDRPSDPVASVEAYRDDDKMVLYDADNPLAWVEATVSVPVTDRT